VKNLRVFGRLTEDVRRMHQQGTSAARRRKKVFEGCDEGVCGEEGHRDSGAHLSCNPLAAVIRKLLVRPRIFWEYDRCIGLE